MSVASSFSMASSVAGTAERPVRTTLVRVFTHDFIGLRGLTLERIAWTFVFVVGFDCWTTVANVLAGTGLSATPRDYAEWFAGQFVAYIGVFFPAMLAMTVADNLPLRGAARVAALTLALTAGAIATHPTICMLAPSNETCVGFPSWQSFVQASPFRFFPPLSCCGVIALAYFSLRRDRELAAALHAAKMEHTAIERRTLESDLQVMQARVEPEFLLGTLDEVAKLCDTDPQTSERVLEELVVYLRAALPDMRGTSSRLGREIDLVAAWLAIVEIRTGGRRRLSVDAGPELHAAKFPPMTLLPLLASALLADIGPPGHAVTTRIAASRNGTELCVRIVDANIDVRSTATGESLCTTRERLQALYGDKASLNIETVAGGEPEIVLQIPFER